jgi:hypothetical protein
VSGVERAAAATQRGLQAAINEAQAATRAVQRAMDDAARLATKKFNDFKASAEASYNHLAAEAAKAASDATKFVNDVGDAFSELGNEIKCAHTSTQQYTPSRTQSKILCATTRVDIAQGRRRWSETVGAQSRGVWHRLGQRTDNIHKLPPDTGGANAIGSQ